MGGTGAPITGYLIDLLQDPHSGSVSAATMDANRARVREEGGSHSEFMQ
jgi:hypothetical protein